MEKCIFTFRIRGGEDDEYYSFIRKLAIRHYSFSVKWKAVSSETMAVTVTVENYEG